MKITVVTTGGTIDSVFDGEKIDVDDAFLPPVIRKYQSEYGDVEFSVIRAMNILSEHLTPSDLEAMAKTLYAVDPTDADGVIVTCGSDTLAYIAAFVGLLFHKMKKPLALVASNLILSAKNANGYENFKTAVQLMKDGVKGVFVPYRNRDGVMYLHDATDLIEADLHDDFHSFSSPAIVYRAQKGLSIPARQRIPRGVFSREAPPKLKNPVKMINAYPMQRYEDIRLKDCAALLHTLYHSATLDSERARELLGRSDGVPLFLCPLKKGRKLYRSTVDMIALGAIPLYDISIACAYMKLWLSVNQEKMPIETFMEKGGGI